MDMPEPTYSRAYNSHCAALHKAVLEEATKSMKSAEELLAKGKGIISKEVKCSSSAARSCKHRWYMDVTWLLVVVWCPNCDSV